MIVRESRIRDAARLLIWYPVRWFVGLLPLRASFRFFRLLARLHKRLRSGKLKSLRVNILRGIPNAADVDSIMLAYLENHYIDRLHIFTYPRLRKSAGLSNMCDLEGIQYLEEALKQHSGAIITLGHYGPIQLPLFLLGNSGFDIIQVGLPTSEGLSWVGRNVAFRLRLKFEKMIPVRILPADEFLRPLFQHLKCNGVVMMNIDPAGGGRWLGRLTWNPFLGHPIPFPLGPALLSAKTGAPIIPLSIHRVNNSRYLFSLHPALAPVSNPEETIGALSRWYEAIVRQDPGLWHFWDEFEEGKLIRSNPVNPAPNSQKKTPIL